jgi:hypothetical protein
VSECDLVGGWKGEEEEEEGEERMDVWIGSNGVEGATVHILIAMKKPWVVFPV